MQFHSGSLLLTASLEWEVLGAGYIGKFASRRGYTGKSHAGGYTKKSDGVQTAAHRCINLAQETKRRMAGRAGRL